MFCVMFFPRKHAGDSGPPVFTVSIYACQDGALHLHAAIFQTPEGKQAFSTDIAPFVYTVESWWLSGK